MAMTKKQMHTKFTTVVASRGLWWTKNQIIEVFVYLSINIAAMGKK